MKIESTPSPTVGLAKSRQQRPAGTGPASGTSTESTVAALRHAPAPDQAGAPADSERIAEIRQAIADGRLQINAERIADRLIEGAREQLANERKA